MSDLPVLLIGFNRPERLAGLVERLRPSAPRRVYVAVDGPRPGREQEAELVLRTRAVVEQVDWTAEVKTLFRERNVGCGHGVAGAVDWLFQHEDRGLVLEDDLRPSDDLLPFVDELLVRYAADPRVLAVSGCNFVPPEAVGTAGSYRFARVPHVWGWGTWRRAWAHYRLDARGWPRRLPPRQLASAAGGAAAALSWAAQFELVARGAVDTWDYQLALTAFVTGGLTATSNVNLVENVGFGADATHTADRPRYLRPVEPLAFPLEHPEAVVADARSDEWTRRHVLGGTPSGLARDAVRAFRRLRQ